MSLKEVLMDRDGMSEQEADKEIAAASRELRQGICNGEDMNCFCEEYFGLEPDYLMELI